MVTLAFPHPLPPHRHRHPYSHRHRHPYSPTPPPPPQGSCLEWLRDSGSTWLFTGLFSDVERLRPEGLMNMDFLAATLYAAEHNGEGLVYDSGWLGA